MTSATPAASRTVDSPDIRVSTIELFFDLVFVFIITQLTSLLAGDPSALGVAFGLGYLVVTLVHTGMFLRATEDSTFRAIVRLGPFNAITAVLLLVAGFTGGAVQWSLWAGGFVLHWITTYLTNVSGFSIRAAHFVERHGLIVLIALGESVVAIGIGVEGLGPVGLRLLIAGLAAATGIVGLALSPEAELGALVAIVGGGLSWSHGRGDSAVLRGSGTMSANFWLAGSSAE